MVSSDTQRAENNASQECIATKKYTTSKYSLEYFPPHINEIFAIFLVLRTESQSEFICCGHFAPRTSGTMPKLLINHFLPYKRPLHQKKPLVVLRLALFNTFSGFVSHKRKK